VPLHGIKIKNEIYLTILNNTVTETEFRSVSTADLVFFSGCVWAEMRKSVSYKVDFSIDGFGVVQEAQCECAVGQGPVAYCKHVGVCMYGAHILGTTGSILTEQTCTQTLQTFHHTKPYKGSPMKASSTIDQKSYVKDPRLPKHRGCPEFPWRLRSY